MFGPAYLDRVLRVDRPLHGPGRPPLDQSVDGSIADGPGLVFRDGKGAELTIEPPPHWPGPTGLIALDRTTNAFGDAWPMTARGLSWHDDLGGMGAGFAAALGGELISALGPVDDPLSRAIVARLAEEGIRHRPIRVAARTADWTLLVTSGPFGDKLPVGFRGCHAALSSLLQDCEAAGQCDLRVVASLPNRLAGEALRAAGARIRVFAPAMRNMTDRDHPIAGFAPAIDILCCNRREWESLEGREQVAWQTSILAITDGPAGAIIRYTRPDGEVGRIDVPAFPRAEPPHDTNRAGEAFAATLVASLLDAGWSPGVSETDVIRQAGDRASAAAALVLDQERFGFPTADAIDAALRVGRVKGAGGGEPGYNAAVSAGSW